jgi:hypothetical protein
MVVRWYRSMMFQSFGMQEWCYQLVDTVLSGSETSELGNCMVIRWLNCGAL